MLSDHKLTIQDDPVKTISRFIVVIQEYIYQMILQQYLVAL